MPPLPTNNNIFIDRKTRQDYHISSCVSKWVMPGKLQKRYSTAHNLPLNVPFEDGFERPLTILPMFETPLLSGVLINTKSKRAQDDNNDIQISQLLRSMKGGADESPKEKEYYRSRATAMQVVVETKKEVLQSQKQAATLSIACELILVCKWLILLSLLMHKRRMKCADFAFLAVLLSTQ
jgi:hypothetical protein